LSAGDGVLLLHQPQMIESFECFPQQIGEREEFVGSQAQPATVQSEFDLLVLVFTHPSEVRFIERRQITLYQQVGDL
jgi:hypothetical protein